MVLFSVTLLFILLICLVGKYSHRFAILTFFLCACLLASGCWKKQTMQKFLPNNFSIMKPPSCSINAYRLSLSKDRYRLHQEQGILLPNIALAKTNAQRDKYIQNGTLVSLPKEGFSVQKMNYGSPFVHKKMLARLQEIQNRFKEKQKKNGLSNIHIVITSAYRTTSDQKRLRKVNSSATNNTSSHSYGASVDIARLSGKGCKKARPLFQEVLQEMQHEKKLYLCPESKTLHITIRHKG